MVNSIIQEYSRRTSSSWFKLSSAPLPTHLRPLLPSTYHFTLYNLPAICPNDRYPNPFRHTRSTARARAPLDLKETPPQTQAHVSPHPLRQRSPIYRSQLNCPAAPLADDPPRVQNPCPPTHETLHITRSRHDHRGRFLTSSDVVRPLHLSDHRQFAD